MKTDEGLRTIHVDDLHTLLVSASEKGAQKALIAVGLHDEDAGKDIVELRTLLSSYRSAKTTAWQTLVKLVITGLFAVAIFGAAIKLKMLGTP